MTRSVDRERLDELERQAREPEPAEPEIPFPEPAVLALQRAAGNQAVARFLMRQPNLTVTDRQAVASERVLTWFVALAREIRQTEPGTPVQSVPELVYMAGELDGRAGQGPRPHEAVRDRGPDPPQRPRAGRPAARAPRPRRRPRRAGGGDRDPRQPRPHPDRAHLRQLQREHHDLDRRQGHRERRGAQARGRDAAGGRGEGRREDQGQRRRGRDPRQPGGRRRLVQTRSDQGRRRPRQGHQGRSQGRRPRDASRAASRPRATARSAGRRRSRSARSAATSSPPRTSPRS